MVRSVDPGVFPGMTCVNVRMLEGVDVKDVKRRYGDGASY